MELFCLVFLVVLLTASSCSICNQAISDEYVSAYFSHGTMNVTLQRPGNSKKWHPKLYKRKDRNVYMLMGQWLAFVRDNHVEEGDICLLMPTKGGTRVTFTVYLLRAAATHSRGGTGFQRVGQCPGKSSGKMASEEASGGHGRIAKMDTTSSSSDESGEDIPSDNELFESDDLQTSPGVDYVVSSRSYLSEAQKERVVALIREIEPEVTVFVSIMRKCHVQLQEPFLAIFKEYASAYFPHETRNITLQRQGKGKKWHPEFYKRKDRSMYIIRGQQWLYFVRDNHVQEGDICLLLPTNGWTRFTFTVHLLRATAAHSKRGTGFQSNSSSHGRSSTKIASVIDVKEEPIDGEHPSLGSEDSLETEESLESEDYGGLSQPPYFVPQTSVLSKSQKKIVEERVQAIQSEVPICVAIMRKTSVDASSRSMLELSSRYATAVHLPTRGQTVVLQVMRKTWKTKMVIISGRRYLRAGWRQFVRDNDLRIGDICLLEPKKNKRKLTMAVHIISRERL